MLPLLPLKCLSLLLACPVLLESGDKRYPSIVLAANAILLLRFALSHEETSEGEGEGIGEGGRNKGEEEVGIDLLDSWQRHPKRIEAACWWTAKRSLLENWRKLSVRCPFLRDLKAVDLESTMSRLCLSPVCVG